MRQELLQAFETTVAGWPRIEANSHRFGGTEFKYGRVEIGHVHHQNGMVDIPFTIAIRDALVAEDLANAHHLLADSGWITTFIQDKASLAHAVRLMQLSYYQKLSRRRDVSFDDVAALGFSDTVISVAFPALA